VSNSQRLITSIHNVRFTTKEERTNEPQQHYKTDYSHAQLAKPEPELLKSVARDLLRPNLSIERSLSTPDVSLGRVDLLGALENLPEDEEEGEDGDTNVGGEEVSQLVGSPVLLGKHLETVEEDDEGKVHKGGPGSVWLPSAPEDQAVAVDILSDLSLAEADICVADGAPGEERGDSDQVLEPRKHLASATADAHVGEQRDGSCYCNAVDGNTLLVALEEKLGSLSVLRNAEQVTRASVQEGVAGRRCRGQDDGVDDVGQHGDTGVLHRNHPRRLLGTLGAVSSKLGVVGADGSSDDERTEDVEEEDTPEDTLDSLGDVLARVGRLTGRNCDHLNTTVRESCVDECGPETGESSGIACANVFFHRAFFPVPEATPVLVRSTAQHDDQTGNQKT